MLQRLSKGLLLRPLEGSKDRSAKNGFGGFGKIINYTFEKYEAGLNVWVRRATRILLPQTHPVREPEVWGPHPDCPECFCLGKNVSKGRQAQDERSFLRPRRIITKLNRFLISDITRQLSEFLGYFTLTQFIKLYLHGLTKFFSITRRGIHGNKS